MTRSSAAARVVHVWPGNDCGGALYLDDGQTVDYRNGSAAVFRRIAYSCQVAGGGIDVTARSTGAFPTWWRSTEVVVHGVPRPPRDLRSGQTGASQRYDAVARTLTVTVPGSGAGWSVTARW